MSKGKGKWLRSREYSDREAFKYVYYTGGTRMNLYISNAVWFTKGGRGVITITVYWRSPYELDTVSLKKELIAHWRETRGMQECISILRPLSLYNGRRVYQWEVTYRQDERPSNEEIRLVFEELDVYDIQRYAVSAIPPSSR